MHRYRYLTMHNATSNNAIAAQFFAEQLTKMFKLAFAQGESLFSTTTLYFVNPVYTRNVHNCTILLYNIIYPLVYKP